MKAKDAVKLVADPSNPNRMGEDDKRRMAASLEEFGDLSGIILNRATGLLVGGHQRADVLAGGELHVVEVSPATVDGTVGVGYLEHKGKRYSVRVVDWEPMKAHSAMIAANRFGRVASDDAKALQQVLKELQEADAPAIAHTGYTGEEIEAILAKKTKLKDLKVYDPPKMAWALIGIPIGRWVEISGMVEAAAAIPETIVETTANDGL